VATQGAPLRHDDPEGKQGLPSELAGAYHLRGGSWKNGDDQEENIRSETARKKSYMELALSWRCAILPLRLIPRLCCAVPLVRCWS